MTEKRFELRNISLIQAGESIFGTFGLFALGLIGSFCYSMFYSHGMEGIFFHLRNSFLFFVVFYGFTKLISKKKVVKDSAMVFLIKILNDTITIEIDQKEAFFGNINDIKAIRTLELTNKKDDVQSQIYIGNEIFNLASSLNNTNKNKFNDFVRFCELSLHMEIKNVPFSVYTHNLQGVKYIEYFNPKNPL